MIIDQKMIGVVRKRQMFLYFRSSKQNSFKLIYFPYSDVVSEQQVILALMHGAAAWCLADLNQHAAKSEPRRWLFFVLTLDRLHALKRYD